ncbi:MAG: hypothetical protein HY319_20250 [Armatimonadetes bacterium]|nr:hypothetical protein [Armatimonadota bacterium]
MGEQMLELEDLLGELKSAGRVESSGQFSLDIRKATPKLQEYQLKEHQRYFYALKIVQAAIAAGAQEITVDCNNQRVKIEYDGRVPDRTELAELLHYLFESEARTEVRHLRALAFGINTAVGVGAHEIRLDCNAGKEAYCHRWVHGEVSQSDIRPWHKASRMRFYLSRRMDEVARGWWNTANCDITDLLKGRRAAMEKEQAAVYDRCPYAPARISLNGTPVNHFVFGEPRFPGYEIYKDPHPGATRVPWWLQLSDRSTFVKGVCHRRHHLVERHVAARRNSPCSIPVPAQPHATILQRVGDFDGGGRFCELLVGIEMDLKRRSRVTIIEDGVILCQESPELGIPGVVALMSSDGLTKDISGFQVVKNEAWYRRMDELRVHLAEMVRELRAQSDRIPLRGEVLPRFPTDL